MYKSCFAIHEDILRSRMYAQDKELSNSENKEAHEVVILEESDMENKEVPEVVILEESDTENKDAEGVMVEEVEVVYLSSDESDSSHDKMKHVAENTSNSNKTHKNYESFSSNSSLSGSSFFRKSLSVERPQEKKHREETRVRYNSDSINKKRKRVVEQDSNFNKSRKRFRSSSSNSSLSDSSFFRKSLSKEQPHEKEKTRVQYKSYSTLMKRKQVKKHASNLDKSRKKHRSSSSDSSLSDIIFKRNFLSRERSRRKRHKEATTTRYKRSYRDEVASTPFYEPKKEDEKKCALDFYCRDCQITLNCELTYKSHLAGKRHFKAIKAHHLHEIAKGSIELPANPPFVSLDKPRFEEPAAGRRRVRVSKIAKLQRTVDNETRHPMPGLNYLLEINHEKEISYYCQLCDAPCDPTTVMNHLIGSRHQMTCLRYINKEYYERIKRDKTLFSKKELKRILFKDQGMYGKERIKVYIEKEDKNRRLNPIDELYFDRPGPSWGVNYAMKSEHGETSDSVSSNDKYLDTSKADLRCKLCNSHMHNLTMWASHVRGKRHLKNTMKIPGESISKVRSIKASPDVVSELKGLLRKKKGHSVIVGLDYIRETQGPNGVLYNCFLCGAGSTNLDIVDHILLTKHRIKYLEKLQIDKIDNAITLIKQLDIGLSARDGLVREECAKMQERFGKGTVEVYISRDMYRFSI